VTDVEHRLPFGFQLGNVSKQLVGLPAVSAPGRFARIDHYRDFAKRGPDNFDNVPFAGTDRSQTWADGSKQASHINERRRASSEIRFQFYVAIKRKRDCSPHRAKPQTGEKC